MAERSSTQQERGNHLRRQLTPEREAELEKISKQCQEEQTDSGFVDEMDNESFSSIERTDSLNKQELISERNFVSDLAEQTSRLSLQTPGCVTSSAITEQQRNQHAEALRWQNKILNDVKNRECNQDGDSLLHVAIIHRRKMPPGMVEFIIDCARSDTSYLDIYNNLCQTPLHLAVITRESEIVRRLIETGARVDIPDRNGNLPLHLACEMGDIACITEITRPLLDSAFAVAHPTTRYSLTESLDSTNFHHGLTALHLAASAGHKNVVQFLVLWGANINAKDSRSGRTALHHAVEEADVGMVTHLICNCGANINAQTFTECTPLHIATGRGLAGITNVLLAFGADPTIENDEGETPSIQNI